MQSSNDNGQREDKDQRRRPKRGKELVNEKHKHCTRSGLTFILVGMMERNTKSSNNFGSIAIDKRLCGFCLWSGAMLTHESSESQFSRPHVKELRNNRTSKTSSNIDTYCGGKICGLFELLATH
ncbi:hypothetical protein PV325_007444, partial [Microctonus aethiopoides]